MASHMNPLRLAAAQGVYRAAQAARIAWHAGHYFVGRGRMGAIADPRAAPAAGVATRVDRRRLRQAFADLFRMDWRNIEAGIYRLPPELRRIPAPARLFAASRDFLRDVDDVASRKRRHGHAEVRSDALVARYPRYYLQNFHYQSDGWLSRRSADRYEMQVETLFTGAAAAMRRQGLPAIQRALRARDAARSTIVDMGCGEGLFLETVLDNWPQLSAVALDLSPAYLGKARRRLGGFARVRCVEANIEETGLEAASADIVSAVYLFHELPPKVRTRVAQEIARILKPGGVLVLIDTLQYADEPGLDGLLEAFPRAFHEPYYDSYCRLSLDGLMGEAGLAPAGPPTLAFLSKVATFVKN